MKTPADSSADFNWDFLRHYSKAQLHKSACQQIVKELIAAISARILSGGEVDIDFSFAKVRERCSPQ